MPRALETDECLTPTHASIIYEWSRSARSPQTHPTTVLGCQATRRCLLPPPSIKDNDGLAGSTVATERISRANQRLRCHGSKSNMADPNQWRMNDDTKEQQGTSVRGQTASPQMQETTGRIDSVVDIAITAILSDSSQRLYGTHSNAIISLTHSCWNWFHICKTITDKQGSRSIVHP